jgi:RHS repeat-associated protein
MDDALSAQSAGSHGGQTVQPLCQTGCGGGGGETYSVSVLEGDGSETEVLIGSTFRRAFFSVQNTGSVSDTWSLACFGGSGVTCYNVSPGSVTLDPGEQASVSVRFDVGSSPGMTDVGLTATSDLHDLSYDINSIAVSVIDPPTVSMVLPGSGARAIVHNRQPVIRATFLPTYYTVDTTRTVLTFRGDTVSTLARHNRGLIEWEVDSTRWLRTGLPGFSGVDSAKISLQVCSTTPGCTTVTRWVVLPSDSTPVLGFTGMPLENLGGGFASSFGPGFSVSGAEVETGFSVPGYVSMGATRSAGLVYSTRQSYPRAIVNVDLDLPWPASTPSQIKLILSDSVAHRDSLTLTGTAAACLTGTVHRCRASLQADFSGGSYTTPTRKWLRIEAQITSGVVMKSSVDSVEVVVVDRRAAVYGSGWWPAGISQLVKAGNDRLLVGATGAATVYRGNGDSVYVPSPGNFTALVKTAGGWELRPRGSLAIVAFNSIGQLVRSVDQNGNRDSVVYGATGRVDSLIDPTGKRLLFGYDANGRIASITDPAGRMSAIRVNNTTGQLVYDSLSAPAARHDTTAYRYRTYPGTGTVVLYARYGVLAGDSTHVVYDSTFRRRPASVVMAPVKNETGTTVSPVLTYGAYERRGYGALASLDSVYVEMKDSRSNWTRSLLNRWGQSRKTWDTLGTLGRAEYTPEGFVLSSEGKNGDSSRVYTDYDSARRPVRSYLCRGSCSGASRLRTDSLVYDTSHHVIRHIDARGKVTFFYYDALGRDTLTISPDSSSFSRVRYLASGQVDSTTASGETRGTHYQYDAATGNVLRVIDPTGDTLTVNTYDSYGRLTMSESKLHVMLSATEDTAQRRRNRIYYNEANQVDSTVSEMSNSCKMSGGSCSIVFWNHVQSQGARYDRAGRDTASVNASGAATIRHYDLLGRVLTVMPPSDSAAAPRDSLVYDVAGNLRKSINRRGITLEHFYDSRNRDTLTTIPGVGNLHHAFGGPLDQLTRLWYASAVDSIGGTSAEVRWAYDARGRLVADTAYTGTVARATAYAYDTYERTHTLTDALGTWTTGYEAARGIPDSLISPWADTVETLVDGQGRTAATIVQHSAANRATIAYSWGAGGKLNELANSMTSATGVYDAGTVTRPFATDTSQIALAPQWSQEFWRGDTVSRVRSDSLQYDALGRLSRWVGLRAGSVVATEDYDYDANGNITQASGAGTYSNATDRLLRRIVGAAADSFFYDRTGNLTRWREASGTSWTYGYDGLDQLVSVRRNGTLIVRYAYDVLGRRIAKRVYSSASGGTVGLLRFSYHGDQVAFETDSAGSTIGLRYTWGPGVDQLLAVRDAAGNHFYTGRDKLGSVRTLTTRDGTWRLAEAFTPYGTSLGRDTASGGVGIALRYRWTGREYDAETGFYYLRARYYSPNLRRFMQEDPAGAAGGSNPYAYVEGSPLEASDPSGLRPSPDGAYMSWQRSQYGGASPACESGCGAGSTWDGWLGISGSLLGRRITYIVGGNSGPVLVDAPIEAVQGALSSGGKGSVRFYGDRLQSQVLALRGLESEVDAVFRILEGSKGTWVFVSNIENFPADNLYNNSAGFAGWTFDANTLSQSEDFRAFGVGAKALSYINQAAAIALGTNAAMAAYHEAIHQVSIAFTGRSQSHREFYLFGRENAVRAHQGIRCEPTLPGGC